jgi:hypothetical protein
MLLSVHVPKTAGTSFFKTLQDVYGPRVLWHNNDWVEIATPEASERRQRLAGELIGGPELFAQRFDAIHGHFSAGKYTGLFPDAQLVAFVRDPYQHVVSCYEFAVRSESLPHPGHHAFKARKMSIFELIEMYPDHQSMYLDGVPLDRFALIGLHERYRESLGLFERIFGKTIADHGRYENANPRRHGDAYDVSIDVRRAVERYRAGDIELYRRAAERFEQLRRVYPFRYEARAKTSRQSPVVSSSEPHTL